MQEKKFILLRDFNYRYGSSSVIGFKDMPICKFYTFSTPYSGRFAHDIYAAFGRRIGLHSV